MYLPLGQFAPITCEYEKVWEHVAGWVFDHVLRLTREQLSSEGAETILQLLRNVEQGSGHISLIVLSPEKLTRFRDALQDAYLQAKLQGSESFAEPAFYAAFMDRFRELVGSVNGTEASRSSGLHSPAPRR